MSAMDLDEVRRQVTERVAGWDDEDVAVRVEQGRHPLHVTVSSRHPSTYYNQWIDLADDGTVHLPAPDDGFTSVGAKGTTAGTVTSTEDAVTLVVREMSDAVRRLRELQAQHQQRARPAVQPSVPDADLRDACALWQGGQNVGSSPVRGAARVLSGVRHYFRANFITGYDRQARTTPEVLAAGVALLRSVNAAPHRNADAWCAEVGLPSGGLAGRGISSKPAEDPQIEARLRSGQIEMPLWGVSLSPDVAAGFGTRFLFELVGDFPAVPAWKHSGIKDFEQELVTGGRYRVLSQSVPGAVPGGTRRDHPRPVAVVRPQRRPGRLRPAARSGAGRGAGRRAQLADPVGRAGGVGAAAGRRGLGHRHPGTGRGDRRGRPLLGARS
jgi:hypothetical protein